MCGARWFSEVFIASLAALHILPLLLIVPSLGWAADVKEIMRLEEQLEKAQQKRDDVQRELDQVRVEERKLGPDPLTRRQQLAQQELKSNAARRQYENGMKNIERDELAARQAALGDSPTLDQVARWKQTHGQPFEQRREKVRARYRAEMQQIRQEALGRLTTEQRELQGRRAAIEKRLFRLVAEVKKLEHKLRVLRGEVYITAPMDRYRVKPNETATVAFSVDGGKPTYKCSAVLTFTAAETAQRTGLTIPQETLTQAGPCEFTFKTPAQRGVIDGYLFVKDSNRSIFDYPIVLLVGEPDDHAFRLTFPRLSFSAPDCSEKRGSQMAWEVRYLVLGGVPPYRIEWVRSTGDIFADALGNPGPGFNTIYVACNKGVHHLKVRVTDSRGVDQRAVLRFDNLGESDSGTSGKPPTGGEGEKEPGKTAAQSPTAPSSGSSPESPSQAKPSMLTGRFHAKLWDANSGPGWVRSSDYSYTPLIVSIDPNGAISGKANYDLPLDHFNPGWAQRRTAYSQNVRFALDGFTDPKSGKTTLKITEGRRELHHVQKGNNRRIEQIMEFNTTLQGWRVPSPRDEDLLANAYIGGMGRTGQAQKQKDFPNIGVGQDGEPAFVQKGFFNHTGIDPQFEPGTYHLTSNVNYWQDESEAGSKDDLKSTGPTKTPVGAWFLEIGKPADDDDSSDRELLMLAIWPRSPVRCAGNTVQLTANAVYSDNVFEAVDVTDKATWRHTRGLQRAAQKGHYRLTEGAFDEQGRPRSQYVRAGIRKGIDWTADTVKVVPTAPQVHVDEQPESPE